MIGAIRLVNPWRGTIWGSYNERLRVTTADGDRWEIHCSLNGLDFYCGRTFARAEIEAWAIADPLSEGELAVGHGLEEDDVLGEVPARVPDPAKWSWYAFDNHGESRLKAKVRPTTAELVAACKEAIAADSLNSVPLIDRFELWACDTETLEPLALLLTGNTELDARGTFSPLWRFCVHIDHEDYWPEGCDKPPTREFEDRLNERVCPWTERNTKRFVSRLFERIDKQTVRELPLPCRPSLASEPLALPQALLAEPWNTEHAQLRRLWEVARENQ